MSGEAAARARAALEGGVAGDRHARPEPSDGSTLTVAVPMAFRRRGGRKRIEAPDGSPAWEPRPTQVDTALVKALARAFRWRRLLESGRHATVTELAKAERINASYVARILRLTLLAPDIVEAILDGRQGPEVTLAALRPFSVEWGWQVGWQSSSD